MKRISKRTAVLLAVVVAAVMAAVGAYAYFTSTGTGTGTATVGSATAWDVNQTATAGGNLFPDPVIGTGNIQTKTYTVQNDNSGNQNLTSVVVKVALANGDPWTAQADTGKPACTAADFSVGGEAVGASHTDAELAGTFVSGETRTGSVTVQMIENGLNQDNCQGVTVPLHYFAS